MVRMSIDSQPEELDQFERKIRQLEIEKVALEKEKEEVSQKAPAELEKELATAKRRIYNCCSTNGKLKKHHLKKLNKLKEKIEQGQNRFAQAEREGDFAKASEIKYGKLVKLQQELEKEQVKLTSLKTTLIKEEVDEHDIAHVLSRWTGIPAEKLQATETEKLLHMEEILKKRVIGQDEAIEEITHAIQMHRLG